MAVSNRLRRALRWGRDEISYLAEEFLEAKIEVYIDTLADLAQAHGFDVDEDDLELSDAILRALRDEARAHARSVVDTFNRDLDGFLERNQDLPRPRLLDTYDAWTADRADARAELIGVTEAYSAHADATIAFYQANGLEPEFDFGGHPELGDDHPQCKVCETLVELSPHPLHRVIEIGSPHINCRQSWHPSDDVTIDGELTFPDEPAGIVGSDPLVNREGDHESAAEWLGSNV